MGATPERPAAASGVSRAGAVVSRWLYSLGWWIVTPLVVGYLLYRSRRQPAYRRHWSERWALIRPRRRRMPLIWLHAVSVGETRAAEPLIRELRRRLPQVQWLVTCMTPTGRDTAATLFGDSVKQAYLPYDYRNAPRRFLRAWRPSIGLLMETELWPNLMAAAERAGVPMAMVNGRLSEKSLAKGLRWPRLIGPAVRRLSLVVAQSEADAHRLARLGYPGAAISGNLKFDIEPPPDLVERGRQWRRAIGNRPIVLLASSREGEEALMLQAWREAAASRVGSGPSPLIVIVPRHPQRFDEVARDAEAAGWRIARRSAWTDSQPPAAMLAGDQPIDPRIDSQLDLLIGDSMGEMFAYYAVADVAILGGSLLRFGGQNLIEACALGVPVVLGPHTYNFSEAAGQAVEAGAALRVDDAAQAVTEAFALLSDPSRREAMGQRGLAFAQQHRGATERTIAALQPLLRRAGLVDGVAEVSK